MTNHNGLLTDENGVVRGIEVPISNEPVTGFRRIARHEELRIGSDLQMIQRVRIVKLNELGKPLTEAVQEMPINDNVKMQLINAYQDTTYPAQTEGAFVDQTGMPVEETAEGAVEQLRFFQGMTIGTLKDQGLTITDDTSVPVLVYLLLHGEIQKLDVQGRL